jgi:hypothetical protein
VRPKLVANDSQSESFETQNPQTKIWARPIKSAPTSANGSNNPNPLLDIKVNLPNDESDDESDDNSLLSK